MFHPDTQKTRPPPAVFSNLSFGNPQPKVETESNSSFENYLNPSSNKITPFNEHSSSLVGKGSDRGSGLPNLTMKPSNKPDIVPRTLFSRNENSVDRGMPTPHRLDQPTQHIAWKRNNRNTFEVAPDEDISRPYRRPNHSLANQNDVISDRQNAEIKEFSTKPAQSERRQWRICKHISNYCTLPFILIMVVCMLIGLIKAGHFVFTQIKYYDSPYF